MAGGDGSHGVVGEAAAAADAHDFQRAPLRDSLNGGVVEEEAAGDVERPALSETRWIRQPTAAFLVSLSG